MAKDREGNIVPYFKTGGFRSMQAPYYTGVPPLYAPLLTANSHDPLRYTTRLDGPTVDYKQTCRSSG
eukprot:scaffold135140_cov31-Tisochrysis_lutea.AAC.3